MPGILDLRPEHRACVAGAVMQSAAALEAEIAEVILHGPGHHLGSGGIDQSARDFLAPIAEVLDRQEPLQKYDITLHLLKKPALDHGAMPYQHAKLLVQLRNELIHYKSKWGSQMDDQKLFLRLENLKLAPPSFSHPSQNFFPHRCLGAALAIWCVNTGKHFIMDFYKALGVSSPLSNYDLTVPPVA